MLINITPMGKPRQTQSDRWRQRPVVMRYRQYADQLREAHPMALPEAVRLVFYIEMPKSWSKKEKARMDGRPHMQKPDIDNLVKAVLDPLAPNDQYVWKVEAAKYWATEPGICIKAL